MKRLLTVLALTGLVACASGNSDTMDSNSPAPQRLANRQIVLITGSTDGLGREVARRVAKTGAHVIVHGRNQERGQALVAEIKDQGKGSAAFYPADLASLAEVRRFAQAIDRDYDRLDVLVNNAGIWLTRGERQVSADGHEMHFAVNYLAGFLLTHSLLPLLEKSPAARIVNVASIAQTPIDFDNVMLTKSYSGGRAYGQSKLALVMFTFDLAKQLAGTHVSVNALHPATMMNTTMVLSAGAEPRSTVEEGAAAVMHLITAPDVGTGQYFNGQNAMRAHGQAYDADARARLNALTRQLVGLPYTQ